jgi:hypothetical protein
MPPKPSQKIGRNDLCPCGSGIKHKQCCLKNDDAWRRQHQASAQLAQKLQEFAFQHLGAELPAAWSDFNQQAAPPPLEDDPNEAEIFIPYFLFDWAPRPDSPRRPPGRGVVAQSFLRQEEARLPQTERLILEQALTQPLSFYEVVRSRPGEGMALRDVLIGGEVEVMERAASRFLRPGDLAYGQLCELPGSTTLGRLAPLCIPPERKPSIVALRTSLRKKIAKQNRPLTVADLILHREQIRTVYLDVRDRMRTPPTLTNTDGDPFVLHTLTFRTGSAHAAFEALSPLASGISKQELLQPAEVGADGALQTVEIPWLKKGNRMHEGWETTLLGTINISGRSLMVEVNSEKRAIRIRREIEKRLGILATHQKTVTTRPDFTKKQARPGRPSSAPAPALPQELQAELQQEAENWIHQKVPALGGRTPLQAARDPEGQELVLALLLGWERQNEKVMDPHVFRPDIKAIRRLLQLPNEFEGS